MAVRADHDYERRINRGISTVNTQGKPRPTTFPTSGDSTGREGDANGHGAEQTAILAALLRSAKATSRTIRALARARTAVRKVVDQAFCRHSWVRSDNQQKTPLRTPDLRANWRLRQVPATTSGRYGEHFRWWGSLVMYDFSGEVATYPAGIGKHHLLFHHLQDTSVSPDRLPKYRRLIREQAASDGRTAGSRNCFWFSPGRAAKSCHDARRCLITDGRRL